MQIHGKSQEYDVLPKHLKPTKQLPGPFPSLFRNNRLLSTKPSEVIGPPQSDNRKNGNCSDVADFDGNSCLDTSTAI